MKFILYLSIGFISTIILISLIWRFLSGKVNLPCPVWLGWLVELDNPFAKPAHAKVIVENINLASDMKVIDIGCGPGRVTIPIAKRVGLAGEVTAMDIQPGMLEKVKEKAKANNINNIKYINAGIGEGKLTRNYYDRALLVTVLGEIPDQKAALKEIFDALKPNGILSVTETIFDPHFQNREKVVKLTDQIGFKTKSVIGNRLSYTMLLEKV